MPINSISLFELNGFIKEAVKSGLQTYYWITGEISELKVNASGHCYLELVEKDEKKSLLIAKARATIWSTNFRMIKPYFETTTGTGLTAGIRVLVKVVVEFHELYGLNLNIIDIEPSFTVGELARRKREIINRLTDEGVIEMNKELEFPRLPKKIAVISSKTAAGFGDFSDQIQNNPFGYSFYLKLFPAIMQGEDAEQSIIKALEKIHEYEGNFDIVVIIRGGGSQADLDCFNNYLLSLHIAQFPLPILTGIGHEQDETIADIVAHTRLKTPTAVAGFLIDRFHEEEMVLKSFINELTSYTEGIVNTEKERLSIAGFTIGSKVKKITEKNNHILGKEKIRLNHLSKKLINSNKQLVKYYHRESEFIIQKKIIREKQIANNLNELFTKSLTYYFSKKILHLDSFENKNFYLNPVEILKRGYSITMHKNKVIKNPKYLKKEDLIQSIFYNGSIDSKVIK